VIKRGAQQKCNEWGGGGGGARGEKWNCRIEGGACLVAAARQQAAAAAHTHPPLQVCGLQLGTRLLLLLAAAACCLLLAACCLLPPPPKVGEGGGGEGEGGGGQHMSNMWNVLGACVSCHKREKKGKAKSSKIGEIRTEKWFRDSQAN